jgi:cytochrome subunit of sulfide dehydrogenase
MIERKTLQPRMLWTRSPSLWIQFSAAIVAILSLASVSAQGLSGEGLADACTSCHGIGGRSQGYIPSIAGIDKATLLRRLKAFRAQTAEATIMNRITRAYTDPELEALADYFSSAPTP